MKLFIFYHSGREIFNNFKSIKYIHTYILQGNPSVYFLMRKILYQRVAPAPLSIICCIVWFLQLLKMFLRFWSKYG